MATKIFQVVLIAPYGQPFLEIQTLVSSVQNDPFMIQEQLLENSVLTSQTNLPLNCQISNLELDIKKWTTKSPATTMIVGYCFRCPKCISWFTYIGLIPMATKQANIISMNRRKQSFHNSIQQVAYEISVKLKLCLLAVGVGLGTCARLVSITVG